MAEWYYTTNNQQMGPVSWDELRQLASSGLLHTGDMVWKEGMIDWVKASKKDGLFSERSAPGRADPDEAPRRRSRERRDDDRADDRDDFDDRPRRRKRAASAGMPLGAKVAIIGGSIAVGLLVVVVVIVLLLKGGGPGVVNGPNNYQITLTPGREDTRHFQFNAGQNVRITVTTQAFGNPDVDLFVTNNRGWIVSDTRVSKDCFLNFVAPATDNYRVQVRNLGPVTATSVVNVQ